VRGRARCDLHARGAAAAVLHFAQWSAAVIEAQQLKKHFGPVAAVREVSLRAGDGRITRLLGPNRAGKATTRRMLHPVRGPDGGEAHIGGCGAVREPLAARARLGVLPHGAGIYPNLTARENILYFGALQGLPRAARRARAAELVKLLEMGEF